MKTLLFGIERNFYLMAEEGGDEGAGGGAGGAGSEGGGDDGAGSDGAEDGGAGEGGEGVLSGGKTGAGGTGSDSSDTIDWDNITDADFFSKVTMPEIEGLKVNSEFVQKQYGEFCRKHHIDPKVVSEFMKLEGDAFKNELAERKAASEAEAKAIRENFDAQGKALRAEFNQIQIDEAVKCLQNDATLNGDEDFMKMVTGPMSNNKTMMRLILNWADNHKTDTTSGAGGGAGSNGDIGFAARWIGRKM